MREPVAVDLAQVYDTALAGTKQIIDKADPEGLPALGAPLDGATRPDARRLERVGSPKYGTC